MNHFAKIAVHLIVGVCTAACLYLWFGWSFSCGGTGGIIAFGFASTATFITAFLWFLLFLGRAIEKRTALTPYAESLLPGGYNQGARRATKMLRFTIRELVLLALVVALASFALSPVAAWQNPVEDMPSRDEAVRLEEAASVLVKGTKEVALQYEATSDPSLAILGAWRCCQLAVDSTQDANARFIGYLEGKIGAHVPTWMVDRLYVQQRTPQNRRGQVLHKCAIYSLADEGTPVEINGHRRYFAKDVTVRFEGGNVQLQVANKSATLPSALFVQLIGRANQALLAITDNEVLVGPNADDGSRFVLTCFDRVDAKTRWKSEVWADGAEKVQFKTGAFVHFGTINIERDICTVAGYNGHCYIEAFRLNDGKPIARWSSSYWSVTEATHAAQRE